MRGFKLILTAALLTVFAQTANADVLKEATQLTESEMAQLCGGYTLPNGMVLNIGIDNRVSVNGSLAADSQINLNGNIVTTNSAGVAQVNGLNGATYIVQQNAAGLTMIRNTADNVALAQTRTINIDITNMPVQTLLTMHSISAMQSQAINGLRNGIH